MSTGGRNGMGNRGRDARGREPRGEDARGREPRGGAQERTRAQERPWAQERGFGDKPLRENAFGEKPFGEKPFKDKSRFAPRIRAPKPGLPEGVEALYGIHAVQAALANKARAHRRLLVTDNALVRLKEGPPLPIAAESVRIEEITALLPKDAVHQGVYLETHALPGAALADLPRDKILVALDQVTDPHNVGAILRSCAAFDVGAVLTPTRHSAEISGVLAKAASGALELVPIAPVANLGRALAALKAEGFTLVGLDSQAPETLGPSGLGDFSGLGSFALRAPVVLVLGAEGRGLRPSIAALCNHLARLDLPGQIKSLNVSNAAAISLFAVYQALRAGK